MPLFQGFEFDSDWQFIANEFDLSDSNIMSKIDESSDLIFFLITDIRESSNIQERVDEFILFIGFAASTGHPIAVALSCFIDFEDTGELASNPFAENLPVPIDQMDDDAIEFMIDLYESLVAKNKSETGMQYLFNHVDQILDMAEKGDAKMQFLYGLLAFFNGQSRVLYRSWYESSALGGFELAYYHTAGAFGGDSADSDWGKSAYWNYQGMKTENKHSLWCCYNLGVFYALGDFVKKDLEAASFYLSLAYRNANKIQYSKELKNLVISAMKEHLVTFQEPPYYHEDKELHPALAELSHIY